jgi:hypothetical protein
MPLILGWHIEAPNSNGCWCKESRGQVREHAETEKSELQRLKPFQVCGSDVVAEATTHKDSSLLTRSLTAKLN